MLVSDTDVGEVSGDERGFEVSGDERGFEVSGDERGFEVSGDERGFVTKGDGVRDERLDEGRCGSFRPVDPRLLGTSGGLLGQDCDNGKGDPIFNGPEVNGGDGDTMGLTNGTNCGVIGTLIGSPLGTTGLPFCTGTPENVSTTGLKVSTETPGREFATSGTGLT